MARLKAHSSTCCILSTVFALMVLTFSALGQQGSAGTVASLQSRFSNDRSGLVELLNNTADSPDQLRDGSTASALANLQSELDNLNKQVDGARGIIGSKLNSLQSNQDLPSADRVNLSNELNRQLTPLNELKSSISALGGKVDALISVQIPKWQQSYKNYADIMGADKARENLRKSVKEFSSSLGQRTSSTDSPMKKH